MNIKFIKHENDYKAIYQWIKERGLPNLSRDMLSEFGLVVEKDSKPLGALWLYPMLSSKWCMIRFPITDNDISKEMRNEVVDMLLNTSYLIAKDMGYKYLFCSTNHPGFQEKLETHNYVKDAENCSHYLGRI